MVFQSLYFYILFECHITHNSECYKSFQYDTEIRGDVWMKNKGVDMAVKTAVIDWSLLRDTFSSNNAFKKWRREFHFPFSVYVNPAERKNRSVRKLLRTISYHPVKLFNTLNEWGSEEALKTLSTLARYFGYERSHAEVYLTKYRGTLYKVQMLTLNEHPHTFFDKHGDKITEAMGSVILVYIRSLTEEGIYDITRNLRKFLALAELTGGDNGKPYDPSCNIDMNTDFDIDEYVDNWQEIYHTPMPISLQKIASIRFSPRTDRKAKPLSWINEAIRFIWPAK